MKKKCSELNRKPKCAIVGIGIPCITGQARNIWFVVLAIVFAVISVPGYCAKPVRPLPQAAKQTADAPLMSAATLAALKKANPGESASIQAVMSSGKLPATLSPAQISAELNKVPIAQRTQIIAALKAAAHNPFTLAYNVKQLMANVPTVSSFIPFVNDSHIRPHVAVSHIMSVSGTTSIAPVDVALGRVSGIILSGGVHALYEADGNTWVLQPGDPLPDGAGRIVSIDPTGIIVKISGDRYVRVDISANAQSQNTAGAQQNNLGNNPALGNNQ
jgi:hypothetical protein